MTRKRKSVAEEAAGDQPVYLVVEHKVKEPSQYSLIITGTTTPQAMIPLRHAKRGMSFAVVGSRWIVGVGGDYRCHFTIYDLTTSTESGGPWLYTNKVNPILIPHRDMLYILSSRPKIDYGADFLPWFEGIVFRDGRAPQMGCVPSRKLPPPPIFPYCINPLEYLHPPDVRYAAHAVVGSQILLSVSYTAASDSLRLRQQLQMMQFPPEPEEKGTCAFDVDTRAWEMVDSKNLPFVGEARPLGGHLFAAARSSDGATVVYHIEILTCDSTKKTHLSILELPMEGRRIIQGQLFSFSGAGRLCTFDVQFNDPVNEGGALKKVFVVQSTYDVTVVDANGETIDALASVVVKRSHRRSYKLVGGSRLLAYPAPVVSALTL